MSAYRNFIERLESEIGPPKLPKATKPPNVPVVERFRCQTLVALVALVGLGEPDAARFAAAPASWDREDWHSFFAERAAIIEFDGHVPRIEAESRAYQDCIAEWMRRHPPVPGRQERCAECRKPETSSTAIILCEPAPPVWLHGDCWRPWHARRLAQAQADLQAAGINAITGPE